MPKITHGGVSHHDEPAAAPTDPELDEATAAGEPAVDEPETTVGEDVLADDYDSLTYDEIRHEVGLVRAAGEDTPPLTSSREALVEFLRGRS